MSKKGIVKRKSDKELDYDAMIEENVSIFATIGLALLFILIGIGLGYLLYKLALNSSAVIVISNLF